MQALGYYFALPFIYFISILPPFIFYRICDLTFVFVYYVTGYRKKIVLQNLRNAFPEKSISEIKNIRKKFYRNFCDVFLETLKQLTMTGRFAMKHCDYDPKAAELFDHYYENKQHIIVVMGHFGNWEWAGATFPLMRSQHLYAIYRPLSNKYFDRLTLLMRTRFGTRVIPADNVFREMVARKNEAAATVFIADQTPQPENAYWTIFLNQETPVYRGTETIARKLNFPVIYASVRRMKRGHYRVFAEKLFEEPAKTAPGEVTEAHVRILENDIRQHPEFWLWSHRRWKHRKPS
jgi:KDO2-lipid IV(A) lauroyltransferase